MKVEGRGSQNSRRYYRISFILTCPLNNLRTLTEKIVAVISEHWRREKTGTRVPVERGKYPKIFECDGTRVCVTLVHCFGRSKDNKL